MIIKRNEFTSLIENGVTKEEKKMLNNVAGLRPHFVVLLSLLVDFWNDTILYPDKNYSNENRVECSLEPYIPNVMKQYYVGTSVNGRFDELRFNFSKVPIHLIQQFCKELRKNMFQYMIENNDEVLWNEKYLVKILENILAITKLNIDDFS
jgi:hypothetical protein